MMWEKLGLIVPKFENDSWCVTHASIPTPLVLEDRLRLYFSTRDRLGISRVGFLELDSLEDCKVTKQSSMPVFDIGEPGCFDDNGVLLCSVSISCEGLIYMYYAGFELCDKIRYRIFTGLACSTDGGLLFKRRSKVPILDRTSAEPFFRCGPYFAGNKEGNGKLYYVGGSKWLEINQVSKPCYVIKSIPVRDFEIIDSSEAIIPLQLREGEFALGRPWLDGPLGGCYVSIRSLESPYRLSYYNSDFVRDESQFHNLKPDANIDDQMQCYASVFQYRNGWYLAYNGNNFGESGIIIAKWTS